MNCSILGSFIALILIIFLILSLGSTKSFEGTCPKYLGSSSDGQRFFADKKILRNWTEAGKYCQDCNLMLATISSPEQNAFLKLALVVNNSEEQYWTAARENRHTLASLAWDHLNTIVEEGIFEDFTDATGGSDVTPYQNCGMYEVKSVAYALMAIKPCRHQLGTLCMIKPY